MFILLSKVEALNYN